MSSNLSPKRIATDIAGYGLILLGIATGWLPGPGGIPLIVAGLGLLSIHNEWARRLREYVLKQGSEFIKKFFPKNPLVQWLYDAVTVGLFVVVAILAWSHAAIWQISLAIALFFSALFIAALNRDRLATLKQKIRK